MSGKPKKAYKGCKVEIKRVVDGKVRHFYGKSRREAETKYKDALVKEARLREEGEPFDEVARAFWQNKERKLKYGSRRGYKMKVETAIGWFGSAGMRTISASDINRELTRMALQGKAYKTISGQKSILSLIWQYWCAEMGGDSNPVQLLKLPQGLPQTKRRAPTDEEIECIKKHPEGFGLCPNLMIYTGLRLGEVMALQRSDFDLDRNIIHVGKACVWHGNAPEIDIPKTANAVRDVPLLAPLRALLVPVLQNIDQDQYLFGGYQMMTKSAYNNAWLQYCKSIGLAHPSGKAYKTGKTDRNGNARYKVVDVPDFTAHQLRHAFASVLVECNIPEPVAKEILGHADIITTHRWYTDVKSRQIADAATVLNTHLETVANRSL